MSLRARLFRLCLGLPIILASILSQVRQAPLPAQEKKPAGAHKHMEVDLGGGLEMKLVHVRPGKFVMGSPAEENGRWDGEWQHEVEITRGFWMGVYTVTQEEYKQIMGTNPSAFSPSGEDKGLVPGLDTRRFPVEKVSWREAREFCRKLSEIPPPGRGGKTTYRLPTEAEWEYACRAGTTGPFHYGDSLSSKQANFDGHSPYGGAGGGPFLVRTARVGSYEPNAFGVYDMHGNVFQWCEDWYKADYYKESPARDPQGPAKGKGHVIRGGCWASPARFCRSAFRCGLDHRDRYTGFRVVADLP